MATASTGNAHILLGGRGAIAEQVLVQTSNLAPIHGDLSFADAASMPVGGTTAVEAIDDSLKLQPGQKVFGGFACIAA